MNPEEQVLAKLGEMQETMRDLGTILSVADYAGSRIRGHSHKVKAELKSVSYCRDLPAIAHGLKRVRDTTAEEARLLEELGAQVARIGGQIRRIGQLAAEASEIMKENDDG